MPGLSAKIPAIGTINDAKIASIRAAQEQGLVSRDLDAPQLLDVILALAYGNLILTDGIDNYSPGRRDALATVVRARVTPAP